MYSVQCVARRFFVLCLAILIIAQIAFSKPDGAPIAACEDMTPDHFVKPQSSVCPFTSKLAREEMWSNGTVEVTLEHDRDEFKGFFMMAFDGTGSDSSPIGTFSSDLKGKGKAIDCRRDGTKNAVTHKDRSLKNSVVATWTPPEDFDGTVVFKATFVKSFDEFWVKQLSPTLIVKRAVVSDGVKEDSTTTKKPAVSTTKKPAVQKSDDVSDDSTSTRPSQRLQTLLRRLVSWLFTVL
ncbi:putative defense protein isoform X3 [Daphnia pulex]|uniref:putative defense protein isoform X3 n=1 Tax=Daphnia pulex TaxID=6669 RepID=UPI001EDFE632|nr:putative defense protein isoform X3 [Daphnia pulex]